MQPWQIALVYLGVALALAAIGLGGIWTDLSLLPEPASRWWTLATALPAAAAVLLKQRAPWLGLLLALGIAAVDVLTVGGLVPIFAVLELLHAGIVALPAARRRIVLRGIIAVTVLGALVAQGVTGDVRATVLIGLQLGALLGMTYWYANSVAQSAELVELYRERATDLGRLAQLDRDRAVGAERDRVARELHDVVAGHVAAVAIRSEAALSANDAAPGGGPGPGAGAGAATAAGEDRAALRAVRDSSLAAHAALRDLIGVLRSDASAVHGARISAEPGRASLPGLVAEAERSGLRVTLDDAGDGSLTAAADLALGQVVREALANAARHDAGGRVRVRVAPALGADGRPGIRAEIVTRGGAPLPHPELRGSRMGLRLLDERVRAIGGTFSAGQHGAAGSRGAAGPRGTARPESSDGADDSTDGSTDGTNSTDGPGWAVSAWLPSEGTPDE